MRSEVHASEYIRSPPRRGITKHQRLAILRNYIDELGKMNYISITNVVVDKQGKSPPYDVFFHAWQALFQRFENTIKYGNFPGQFRNDKGLVIVDNTEGRKLQNLVRRMGAYNTIPSMAGIGTGARNIPIVRVIEDPHHKDSASSYFIQSCDVCAYFLHQRFAPCAYVRKRGARQYFTRLGQALNKKGSYQDPLGIVLL